MKNRKCIKPHLTHGKNKSIKRIFLILYLFAKIPEEKNRKEKRGLCFGPSWAKKLTFGPYIMHI